MPVIPFFSSFITVTKLSGNELLSLRCLYLIFLRICHQLSKFVNDTLYLLIEYLTILT
jgi:hypothetical protein